MNWQNTCRDLGYMPEQVQDFYPTPSTLSTCMYYTGIDPRDMVSLFMFRRSPHEKAMQRALIQYRDPKHYDLVLEALRKTGRMGSCRLRTKVSDLVPDVKKDSTNTGREKQVNTSKKPAYKKIDKKTNYKKKTIRNVHRKKSRRINENESCSCHRSVIRYRKRVCSSICLKYFYKDLDEIWVIARREERFGAA